MNTRVAKIRGALQKRDLPALLITDDYNRRYATGFTGSAGWVLITSNQALLFTDFRYWEQAALEAPEVTLVKVGLSGAATMTAAVSAALAAANMTRVAVEANTMTLAQHRSLAKALEGVVLEPSEGLVEGIRAVKEPAEVELIRKAASIADAAFAELQPFIVPGAVERDLAVELEYRMRRLGAEKEAFATIVASGPNAALPHHRAGSRRLQTGDLVVFDFGAAYQGYNSDITRTLFLEPVPPKAREIYDIVAKAQEAAMAAVKPGARCGELDGIARTLITQAGYGEHFGHSLGHGVGLLVHEEPRLASTSKDVLEAGMCVTVEPGIYLPGFGGVRIEDSLVVTSEGSQCLTAAPKYAREPA